MVNLDGLEQISVLTKPSETTRAPILEAVANFGRRIGNEHDTLFVYVSSHGSLAHPPGRPLARYLVTSDTRLDLVADTGISVADLVHTL